MNIDLLIRKIIKISETKIIKLFFIFFESIFLWHCNRANRKGKKINDKLFKFFAFFSDGRLYTFHRRQLHKFLTNNLDMDSEIDKKIYQLTNRSYAKLFDLNPEDVKSTIEYFYNQKIYDSHLPTNTDFPSKLIGVKDFLNNEDSNIGSFNIQSSLNSSVVKKICRMKLIWDVAKKYLNTKDVKIFSVDTMLKKRSSREHYVTNLHKDPDSAACLVFFIYWTEVSRLNGATRIVPGNHLFLPDRNVHHYIGEPIVEYLECKGGTVFALDPWAMHAGNPKITSPGIATQIRFTSMPSVTYYLDQNYLFKDNLDEINCINNEK